jgi:putative FmdB family regulatory protein
MSAMPIYEYRCLDCGRKVSIFWRSLSAVDEKKARCEHCSSRRLVRLVSRVRVVRGSSDELDSSGDMDDALLDEMANLDENDPRALGRFMRKMAEQSGEDLGPEFEEVVGRLEKGEDPEEIEKRMGDIFGDEMGGPDDDLAGPSEDQTTKAEKEAEEQDKKATAKRRTVAMQSKQRKTTAAKRSRHKATTKKAKR